MFIYKNEKASKAMFYFKALKLLNVLNIWISQMFLAYEGIMKMKAENLMDIEICLLIEYRLICQG
jgi:hypothetical protein